MADFLTTTDRRKILHVDLDAFYAQIEMRDNPALKALPLIIGRDPRRSNGHGVVATANYRARSYGVHSAMSTVEARRLAPNAVFVEPDFDKYRQNSQRIHQIFHQYTSKIEYVALDEAYLDVTNSSFDATTIAAQIRHQILETTRLTSSIGISYNKLLAKLGSEYNKPNGVTVIDHRAAQDFMDRLPIADFRGVGQHTLAKLSALKIETGYDLRMLPQEELRGLFGKMGERLYWQARGVHLSPVQWQRQRQSVGKEATFDQPLRSRAAVNTEFKHLVERMIRVLSQKKLTGRTLNIKIRDDHFQTITRAVTQSEAWPLDVNILTRTAQDTFDREFDDDFAIRLLGVTLSNLEDHVYGKLSLFDY